MARLFDVTDPHQIIAALRKAEASLRLDTIDLCFLVALRARSRQQGLTSFDEELLYATFDQVSDVTEVDAANLRTRATYAIERLRKQRLLSRIDGSGILRSGEYALTRLAVAVVEFFDGGKALTRDNLSVLTKTLVSQLQEIRIDAQLGRPELWPRITEHLRVTVADLLDGIEQRQHGLDAQQEDTRARIATLLDQDWFESIEACENLLENTSATLRELNEVLLEDSTHLRALIQHIEQLAMDAGADEAQHAAEQVMNQLERVEAWGVGRQKAWSEYFQFVQRYLRTVVRMDPSRALSQRLREQIAGWCAAPFSFVTSDAAPLRVMRAQTVVTERPPVQQARTERDVPLEEATAEAPRSVELERLVRDSLDRGIQTLAGVLQDVLAQLPEEEHFRAAGQIAHLVAQTRRVRGHVRERPWVAVHGDLVVEDWRLDPKEKQR